jgi:hypothetical protein
MHSSRYRRETSRCMHNMHVICIYKWTEMVFQYCSIGIDAVFDARCEMRYAE